MTGTAVSLLRRRDSPDGGKVTHVELFFDLVFVFAITQVSHALLAHLTWLGAMQAAMLLLATWWVWIYTGWVTNFLDPQHVQVRLCLFALMLAGLMLSASIPHAFDTRGLAFACSYVAMQVGRTLFFLWAVRQERESIRRNFVRVLVWLVLSGVFWICGGLVAGDMRIVAWLAALAIEFISPLLFFRVPGLGRSATADWDVDGGHLAERCGLFVIIALGESVLVTGATFAGLDWDGTTLSAFALALLGSIAMWWLYFDSGAGRAHHQFVHAADRGRMARNAYTYLHLPIVGGIIVCAVADELVLRHPGHVGNAGIAALLGGPALYLAGNALFKWACSDRRLPPLSHLAGLGAILAILPVALLHWLSAMALAGLTTAVLLVVATWEVRSLRAAATWHGLPRA